MRTYIFFLFLTATATSLLSKDPTSDLDSTERPKRDLTLIANPAAFPPSAAELAKVNARILKADQDAAVARIAAIDARIRQIREESEAKIKALSEERDALIVREKSISEALKDQRP